MFIYRIGINYFFTFWHNYSSKEVKDLVTYRLDEYSSPNKSFLFKPWVPFNWSRPFQNINVPQVYIRMWLADIQRRVSLAGAGIPEFVECVETDLRRFSTNSRSNINNIAYCIEKYAGLGPDINDNDLFVNFRNSIWYSLSTGIIQYNMNHGYAYTTCDVERMSLYYKQLHTFAVLMFNQPQGTFRLPSPGVSDVIMTYNTVNMTEEERVEYANRELKVGIDTTDKEQNIGKVLEQFSVFEKQMKLSIVINDPVSQKDISNLNAYFLSLCVYIRDRVQDVLVEDILVIARAMEGEKYDLREFKPMRYDWSTDKFYLDM